jgi:hypothetical protein
VADLGGETRANVGKNSLILQSCSGRLGQGKNPENVDKSLVFLCNPRKLCEE